MKLRSDSPTTTAFRLFVADRAGDTLAASDITVDVPAPASLGLASRGVLRRPPRLTFATRATRHESRPCDGFTIRHMILAGHRRVT